MADTVSLQGVFEVLASMASVFITAAVPIVVPLILKKLHVDVTAAQEAKIDQALTDAAGGMYRYALAHDGGLASIPVHDAALAQAVNTVQVAAGAEAKALGLDPDDIAKRLAQKLGTMLAQDPAVSATGQKATLPPPPVVAPAVPTPLVEHDAPPPGPLASVPAVSLGA